MEEIDKELLENLKNFEFKKLFIKKYYVELQKYDSFYQSYIIEQKENDKYELYIINHRNKVEVPINMLNFYSENEYTEQDKIRDNCINIDLLSLQPELIINTIKEKIKIFNISNKNNNSSKKNIISGLPPTKIQIKNSNKINKIPDKNGKMIDITGYQAFQFFCGYILDCLAIINNELLKKNLNNSYKNLFILILEIVISLGEIVKLNLNKYKNAYYNRKLLIVSQIHAILVCYDSFILNLTQKYQYDYSRIKEVEIKFIEIANLVNDIILASKDKSDIPLPCLIIFFKFIVDDNVKRRIKKYDNNILYGILNEHLKNLNENELKYFKKNSDMKEICNLFIKNLIDNNMKFFENQTYYSYFLSCLKCKNLEKKMNALNGISDIINEFQGKDNINSDFKNFIENNKILDVFFEESIHDEIIKRSFNLFKYFAKYDSLNDKIIEKIISRQENNDLMKKLLIEIVSELPRQKKDKLFIRLSQGIKFDNVNNIEYISKLTESCFNKTSKNEIQKKEKNYYGLMMIFDYIIKDFDDKKKYNENNVDVAIDFFEHTISKIISFNSLEVEEVFFFIDKLFDNIKSNNKKNSVLQSIKLIQKLFDIIKERKDDINLIKNLKKLDEKYDIISLLINDLIRYMKLLPSDYTNEKGKGKIYEGVYPHNINIEQRLKIIFYFFKKDMNNYGLIVKGKKLLEQIYKLFKNEKFKIELKKFYEIFTKNIDEIDNLILIEFFKDILQNKEEFNLKEINDDESINLIINVFKKVNENKGAILNDGRKIRIEVGSNIEGSEMLFDLLTQNSYKNVQNKISDLLCDLCLSFKDYNNPNISEYWKIYLNKITLNLDIISKSNDKIAFNGIVKLLNKIYSSCCNCYGKIPEKEDYPQTQEPFKFFHFLKVGTKREYRLKAGNNDRIIDLRWKSGYYFDIHVNNVTFIDIAGKRYTLNNDFENFNHIFSNEKYFQDRNFAYIKVDEVPFNLLQMKDNPKDLIEKNENIYNILIDNLKLDLKNDNDNIEEIQNKQKIWNIITKLPKNLYFINKQKKYGNKDTLKENNLLVSLDIDQIYLMTYSLQCFYYFLFDKKNGKDKDINQIIPNKKEYLKKFIGIYKGDKLLIDKLLCIKIDSNNCKPIQIECLTNIIDVLYEIEKFKKNEKEIQFESIFGKNNLLIDLINKLTEINLSLLELNYTKYKNYLFQGNDDNNEHNKNNNEMNKININENIAKLIGNIFSYIEEITKGKIDYMKYVFNNNNLFIQIFVYDYIKCEADESRKIIDDYLLKNYVKNKDYIKKYFEIILTVEIFNYLVKNDKAGKYFHIISSIIKKYYEDNTNNNNIEQPIPKDNTIIDQRYIQQSKQIIDIILDYIKKECEKEENNENLEDKERRILMKNEENFKEGIILFLTNILNLNLKELINYIMSKVDIFDLFLNKCILRKCNDKPLENKYPFCRTNQTQSAIYKLIFMILRNIQNNDLYIKIFEILDKYHQLGFWKTCNNKNWELESKEMQKGKYVGLKNMTATCYLNSIIQQLYMIPMFRETILKIHNTSKKNVLYELQLLFSALKIYEFAYYDPRSFVVINKLNFYEQMDADEFYGTLIDRIENDIKKLYYKSPSPNQEESKDKKRNTPQDSKNEDYKYKDIFNYFFGIKVLDELKFVDCGHKRYNEFFYNNIQLEIKEFNNIHESLKYYFKTEVMDGDNKINCEQCKIKRTCHKHLIIKSLPNILVIALKRFEFDYNTMLKYKLNKYFEFPHKLDMKDYLIENHKETNTEYELTGITIHFGVSDFGHYYDLIKGPNNKWYKFNDTNVSEFKEEDISREAYGEKEILEEDSYKEKENGKNNAYILIYKKTSFNPETIDKKNKSDLALPPFNKFSNINEDIKNEINLKLYKSWVIKNIASNAYLNFILSLIKLDLANFIDKNLEKSHNELVKILKDEGFIVENRYYNSKNHAINSNKIFEFALRYYFCIFLRTTRKIQDKTCNINYFELFKEIIKVYLDNDIRRAKFVLEEFSNTEAINEYIIFCPNIPSIKDCLDIIIYSYNLIYKNYISTGDSFIYNFMNTLIIYINNNIRKINLENINYLFNLILNIGGNRLLSYLKKRNIEKWLNSFYGPTPNPEDVKRIMNENIFPTIHSPHCILIDKTNKNNFDIRVLNEENDYQDQHFLQKLLDIKNNVNFIGQLCNFFHN